MNSKHSNDLTLFNEALEIAAPEARVAYLDRACGADAALRRKIDSLLAAYEKASDSFEDLDANIPTLVPETTRDLEGPGSVIGRYKLLQKIGEGGCGVVYMAEQEEPVRRRVALKVIKLGMDTKSVIARFEAERQALAMMDHPNIAKIYDAGATEAPHLASLTPRPSPLATHYGRPYFVMELVRGVKITEYCDEAKLSTRDRLDLFIKVCQAIQHAHQKGIIHRDIKPSNILVTINDGVAVPKVIDFGIAKATEGRLTDKTLFTQFAALIGTPAYMSPEQAVMTSLDIDTRSDIYSLGVLLYELLAGSTPFDAKELMASGIDAMRKTIREKEPLKPSTKLSQTLVAADVRRRTSGVTEESASSRRRLQEQIHQLQGDLDWIVMKCLEKDRARRYETANGLASDLQRHLNNEAVLARPPSAAYRFQKLVRRNKLGFAAAAVVMTALILGVVTTSWQKVQATRARDRAEAAERTVQKSLEAESQARGEAESAKERAETAQRETARHLTESQRQAYYANMNLVQADWEQNSLARVGQSLKDTRDYDDRGFEWYYWQREMHRDVRTLRGHLDRVGGLAISPDGRRIATASNDGTVKVWDFATGREVSTCIGHTNRVRSVAFFPDSRRVVSCGNDTTVRVWEANTGRHLQTLKRDTSAILSVAVSRDTPRIVSGSAAGAVTVWDVDTERELHTLRMPTLPEHSHVDWEPVWGVDISADGHRVLAGSADGKVNLWDLRRGQVPLYQLPHSPDDHRSHAAGDDKTVWSVAFSPDGKSILSAGKDGIVKLWDAFTGQPLRSLTGPGNWVFSARFSPDGRRIVTGSGDGRVRVLASDTGEELEAIKGHRGAVWSVAFAPDAHTIVTSGGEGDHTAKVWDVASASGPLTLKNGPSVWSVAFSPDNQWLATGGHDGAIRIWKVVSGNPERTFEGHTSAVYSVAFCPQGHRLVTGSADGTVRVWDFKGQGKPLVFERHSAAVHSVAFSPDGRWIATGSGDKTVKLWEASSGRERFSFEEHRAIVRAVAFSPQGDWIVSGGEDSAPRIWDCSNGLQRQHLVGTEDKRTIYSLAVSPDGQRIAAARWLATATVWDITSGRHPFDLNGHTMDMSSAAISPDGRRLVTGNSDRLVKVWDASTGRELLTLRGHAHYVQSVAFSPDGLRIASGSLDGTAKIWVAATPEQVATWHKEEAAAEQKLEALRRERLAGKQ